MAKPFTPTPHPVLGLPTPAQMAALGKEAWAKLMVEREQRIAREREEPFPHWFEPPIWKVCDALLGFPWVDPAWAEAMRKHLGFHKPVNILLINGGNRSGKSEYASDRVMRVLRLVREHGAPRRAWCLHSTLPMSRDYQQPLLQSYLPKELRGKDIKTQTTYIAYKQKTGFSEEKFVLPDRSDCVFKAYEQDRRGIEGGNVDIIWPDELVPPDWVETMELRIAEKGGWMPITFTPVEGYTETVRLFQDGAEVVKESVAYLLPKDGGPVEEARALGLMETELAEIKRADLEHRAALVPQSRPEDCNKWLEEKAESGESGKAETMKSGLAAMGSPSPRPSPPGEGEGAAAVRDAGAPMAGEEAARQHRPTNPINSGQPAIPEGRDFELVPRVMKCVSSNPEQPRACVFFHTSDNPYGNPKSVWATIAGKDRDFKVQRFYGVATKNISARFPKFNLKVHVVKPDQIPKEGTNYQVIDPAGRNFFIKWYRVTANRVYLYREWPGNYMIPDVGLPGPWALPDGKNPDGRKGPAQKAFGWGSLRYKEEIARLEGWTDHKERPATMNKEDWDKEVEGWDPANGAREEVQERFMDSRFASTPKMENDRPITLLETFSDIHLHFTPTPGDDIEEGVQLIQDALDYDDRRPVDFFNCPRYLVCSECANSIYAYQTWTGYTREGRRNMDGATKDPIDDDRYFFLSDCQYLGGKTEDAEEEESEFGTTPAGYY